MWCQKLAAVRTRKDLAMALLPPNVICYTAYCRAFVFFKLQPPCIFLLLSLFQLSLVGLGGGYILHNTSLILICTRDALRRHHIINIMYETYQWILGMFVLRSLNKCIQLYLLQCYVKSIISECHVVTLIHYL